MMVEQDVFWSDFFYTELTTGLRRGEICGLRWQDFDEKNGLLFIRRSVRDRKGGGVSVGETKTEKGVRTIQLPPSTAQRLRERKKKSFSEWIFHNPTVAELPLAPQTAYHHLKTLLKHAGSSFSFCHFSHLTLLRSENFQPHLMLSSACPSSHACRYPA